MPTAATTVGGTSQSTDSGKSNGPVATVPFIRASAQHREPTGTDVSKTMTSSDQDLGVFDVPAYGYVRSIVILVEGTGATKGTNTVAAQEDAPFSAIKNIALTEPNGAVLSQFNSGYDLFLANKWGGYRDALGADPRNSPVFSDVDTNGNFTFLYRIPVELNLRDGLGSLPNQNAAATFKLRLTLAGSGDVYSTVPQGGLPTVKVRTYLEAWDQPEESTAGMVNQITPPAMNTTQFWSTQVFTVSSGQQTIRLTRVGNYLRNLIFKFESSSSRSTGESKLPDPATLYLDTRPLDIIEKNNWKQQMFERTYFGQSGTSADGAGGLDNGVRVYDFMHEFDGTLGRENRDLWLPTLGSTRLELQGSFGAAGTLTVLTNDVSIAGNVFI